MDIKLQSLKINPFDRRATIKAKHCISSSRQFFMHTYGVMIYNDSDAIVDDMPLLSQWIKKLRTSFEVLNFLAVRLTLEPYS